MEFSIEKHNENHGPDGRFSSGPSGSMSVADAKAIRMNSPLNTEHVKKLTAEMEAAGGFVGKPLQVEETAKGTILTDGHHRLAAAEAAGLTDVPVRIYPNTTDGRLAALTAIVEADRAKEIQKFNPNHDNKGRFSSGSGGSVGLDSWDTMTIHSNDEFANRTAQAAFGAISKVHGIKNVSKISVTTHDTADAAANAYGAEGWYMPGWTEINLNEKAVDPEFVVVHEFGHLMDWEVVRPGKDADEFPLSGSQRMNFDKDYTPVHAALRATPTIQRIDGTNGPRDSYLANDTEMFARAYAQYITLRSGDKTLRTQLEAERRDLPKEIWPDAEFEPVAAAMDDFFAAKGLRDDSIQKFNPNHGSDGRFSTSAGSGGFEVDMSEFPNAHPILTADLVEGTKRVEDNIRSVTGFTRPAKVTYLRDDQMALRLRTQRGRTVGFYQPDAPGQITMANERTSMFFLVHEYGHLLDYEHFSNGSKPGSGRGPNAEALGNVMSAIHESTPYAQWKYEGNAGYWASNTETFARAFAQYVAEKSGDATLLDGLVSQRESQWPRADFAPISAQFDKLFAANATLSETKGQTA